MTHVLLLLEYPSLNGGERSLLCLIPVLQESRFRFTAAAPPTGPLSEALLRYDVELVPLERSAQATQSERREQLRRVIGEVQPSLVHANSLAMSRLAGPVCEELRIPSIGHLRDMMKLSRVAVDDLARHRRLLAVSDAVRCWYLNAGLPADRLHVVYNGVDLEQFQPRESTGYLHQELRLSPGAALIGSIGQIGMRKGLDCLLEAMERTVVRHPSAHLLVIGQRHSQKSEAVRYEQDLQQFSATKLSGKVDFLGHRDDIYRVLNELTLLVHLARQEPLGRVLLEGAASGCCILATNVGGTPEIFPPESNAAYLIQPDDANGAFLGIDHLLVDDSIRRQMSIAARLRAEQVFHLRHSARRLMQHYDALIGP